MNRMKLRVWDPVLNKGAIWTYWEGAYRDTGQGRGRDDGASRPPSKEGWFWNIPLHDNIVSRSAWWRRSITCSRAAGQLTSRRIRKRSSTCRR